MWQLLTGILSLADYEFSDEQHPRLIAKQMREDNLFEKLIPEKIEWLQKQVRVEAVELWNHADEEQLRDYCPRAYAILQLAVAMNSED